METIIILVGIAILQSPFIIKGGEDLHTDKNSIFFFRRWISVLLMSPLILYKSYDLEVQMSLSAWFILFFNLNLLFSFLVSLIYKQGTGYNLFAQVNLHGKHMAVHVKNALSLVVYLTGYEIVLRLILINELQNAGFSFRQSAIISLAIYVLLHIPQGWKMTAASILFGIIATAWIVATGSVVPVIILHVACALGYDYIAKSNSQSQLIKNSILL